MPKSFTLPSDSSPFAPPDSAAPAVSTLFDLLPVGAYRSLPDGRMLRANAALVRLNGYEDEASLLAAVHDIATEWYVEPGRREAFRVRLERDGQVTGFVSQVWRHRSRELIWISENAHIVRRADGAVLFYEGTVEDITARMAAQEAQRHSAEQLRLITHQVPGMVYHSRVDRHGARRFLFVSDGVRELLGLSPDELLADSDAARKLWHAEDRERMARETAAARHVRTPMSLEHRVVLADGSVKWVHVRATPIRTVDGVTDYVGIVVDISERKRAEAALRDNDERWKLALDSTGDGVWDWDLASGIETYSPRFLEMYGYQPGELDERPETIDARTHPDDQDQMARDREDHFSGRAPRYVNEHRVRCRDGQWKWILSRGLVIRRDAAGRPLRMIGTHTDITARRHAEALQQQRDRAEAADRAKTQLLSRVSHELRTPLNAVLGFAQLLDHDATLAPHHQAWLKHILASGHHLLGLVEDVLDLSAAQGGQLSLTLSEVPLSTVVDESWRMVAAATPAPVVRFTTRLSEADGWTVRADHRRLRQVLCNLLSNAVKYNRPGGVVEVQARRDAEGVAIDVTDGGVGLDADQLERLFQPFERLGAQHTAVQGTGLGLALSQQLVDAMGGELRASSQPGLGSTFTVRLPVGEDQSTV